jgi:hypothetical protein
LPWSDGQAIQPKARQAAARTSITRKTAPPRSQAGRRDRETSAICMDELAGNSIGDGKARAVD